MAPVFSLSVLWAAFRFRLGLSSQGEANFVSASDKIQALQAEMVDSLELRREDRFVGWYHSHPFDVEERDHCFLSVTDVQTQQSYQSNSAPWTAIVVDPLRSVAKGKPILGSVAVCFRVLCAPVISVIVCSRLVTNAAMIRLGAHSPI